MSSFCISVPSNVSKVLSMFPNFFIKFIKKTFLFLIIFYGNAYCVSKNPLLIKVFLMKERSFYECYNFVKSSKKINKIHVDHFNIYGYIPEDIVLQMLLEESLHYFIKVGDDCMLVQFIELHHLKIIFQALIVTGTNAIIYE